MRARRWAEGTREGRRWRTEGRLAFWAMDSASEAGITNLTCVSSMCFRMRSFFFFFLFFFFGVERLS